jgi:hypothetical protein
MFRRKQSNRRQRQRRRESQRRKNKAIFQALVSWLIPEDALFAKDRFHGNIKWRPEQLAQQALIWAWQETKNVTDAFDLALEVCRDLKIDKAAKTYTGFIQALDRYRSTFSVRLREHFQILAEENGARFWRDQGWVLIGFDGSRVTTARTVSNETAFCASNYGQGKTAKYRRKKTKGMRRRQNKANPAEPQAPQVWITMMWHMGLRLPWTWRLGPSNSSERGHVMEMLKQEEFPKGTLFCGDAGFVGYDFWKAIVDAPGNFLVRVGANVNLLSETADVKQAGGGLVLCWPKGKMDSGAEPLRLRLVRVKIGKTKMWMLTSVQDGKKLPAKKIIQYYKMRWGVEVEYRGLKQTIDRGNLRCRNSARVYAELDWSIRAMAFAELVALREQLAQNKRPTKRKPDYDPKDRSLANTIRALRKCMRNLNRDVDPRTDLLSQLAGALVQKYNNRTNKKARYRPPNPDKKPLGEPTVTKLNREAREKLARLTEKIAA